MLFVRGHKVGRGVHYYGVVDGQCDGGVWRATASERCLRAFYPLRFLSVCFFVLTDGVPLHILW